MRSLRIEHPDGTIAYLDGEQAAEYLKPMAISWFAIDAMASGIPVITGDGDSVTLVCTDCHEDLSPIHSCKPQKGIYPGELMILGGETRGK